MQRRIDTPNGGQSCHECRHYKPKTIRKDVLFGDIPVRSWCAKRCAVVEPIAGESCSMFIKTIFNHTTEEKT